MNDNSDDFIVMTSGGFTAAHLELKPQLERILAAQVVTATTSVGTGDISIISRLRRGERADLVIVAEGFMRELVEEGHVRAESWRALAQSSIALAVRAGEPAPDISSPDALRRTFLAAKTVAYSASVSGKYLTTELYQQLGIADEMLPRSHFTGGGERTGAVVARGDADLAVQQLSELLPVEGIAHITPLPGELNRVTRICAGIGSSSPDAERAAVAIAFLNSIDAKSAIESTGLEALTA